MSPEPFPAELEPWAEREVTRHRLGAAYDGIRKLAPDEAAAAMRERDSLIDECVGRGARLYEANRAKVFAGELSPGCRSCGEGTWSCLDFERRCTRRCFFCPRDPASSTVAPPREAESGLEVRSPEAYAALLKALGCRGASFSGGEPFLRFDRMLAFTREIRRRLGDSVYLWAYTNGDLVNERRVRALAAAGLDELRVDLSARDYDLTPIESSVRWMKVVAVETPAIPEDFDRVRSLLPRLEALGVTFVNLHQLYFTRRNADAFARRGYTVVHSAGHGYRGVVLESELTALRLLREALAAGSSLSVNTCSALYKQRFQRRGSRRRLVAAIASAGPLPPDVGSATPVGLLRRMSVPAEHARPVLEAALAAGRPSAAVERGGRVFVDASLLGGPALDRVPLSVEYFDVTTDTAARDPAATTWDVEVHPALTLRAATTPLVARVTLDDASARSRFCRLLADGAPSSDGDDSDGFYGPFLDLEWLDRRLPEYR